MVADGDNDSLALDPGGDADARRLTLTGAVFQRIVDQVGERLGQKLAIAITGRPCGASLTSVPPCSSAIGS